MGVTPSCAVQVKNMEMIAAPAPKLLMEASVKQALKRLDKVDPEVKAFFTGAAKTVAEGADPVDALAAALGCLSGLTEVPQDRSLLTQVGALSPLLHIALACAVGVELVTCELCVAWQQQGTPCGCSHVQAQVQAVEHERCDKMFLRASQASHCLLDFNASWWQERCRRCCVITPVQGGAAEGLSNAIHETQAVIFVTHQAIRSWCVSKAGLASSVKSGTGM